MGTRGLFCLRGEEEKELFVSFVYGLVREEGKILLTGALEIGEGNEL